MSCLKSKIGIQCYHDELQIKFKFCTGLCNDFVQSYGPWTFKITQIIKNKNIAYTCSVYFIFEFLDSKVYQAIEKIAQERTLMKVIERLSPTEQTSSFELYHRVVCFFAIKSLNFMHAQMEARIY